MINEFKRSLQVFLLTQLYSWRGELAYRVQFIFGLIDFGTGPLITLSVLTVIYVVSPTGINGWSYYQVMLVAGVASMVRWTVTYLFGIANLTYALQNGNVDVYLTRPYSKLMMVITQFPTTSAVGGILGGMALLLYAASKMHITLAGAIIFSIMLVFGTVAIVMCTLLLILASYKLFTGGTWVRWLVNIFFNANEYPLSIYGLAGTVVFTLLLPIGVAVYYPSEVLVGKIVPAVGFGVMALAVVLTFATSKLFYRYFGSYASGGG